MMSQRKLDMVGTWSTVGKQPKRTPDITVQTTKQKNQIIHTLSLPQTKTTI